MKPLVIPQFIMNGGCPHRCLFCNERIAAGAYPERITARSFRTAVDTFLARSRDRFSERQIAFYGGNFTGLNPSVQQELLSFAAPYLAAGTIDSIRISTRPDHLNDSVLGRLSAGGVRTVEIGAQSLDDEVLARSGRGHDAEQVRRALRLLRDRGFETGIHLMAGLPGDTPATFMRTIEETVDLAPDTVRIHPALVFRDTGLARLYQEGCYRPLSLDEAVALCGAALVRFIAAAIPVIRLGMHVTEEMLDKNLCLAGPLHPAFGSLVEENVFSRLAALLVDTVSAESGDVRLHVAPTDESRLRGPANRTISFLNKQFRNAAITVHPDDTVRRNSLRLVTPTTDRTRSIAACADAIVEALASADAAVS